MATPIVPWIGGKRRLADLLIPRFPAHTCYVEVFAGGAALYFLRPPAEVEVINDINGDLVNLYRVVQRHLEEFVRQFKWALSSREVFKWIQSTPAVMVYFVSDAVKSLAGQQTGANIDVNFIAGFSVSETMAWVVGAGGVLYGQRERSLKGKAVKRLHERIEFLERKVDPNRSSSGLTPTGNTNPGD